MLKTKLVGIKYVLQKCILHYIYLHGPLKVFFQGRACEWKNQTNEEKKRLMEIYEREPILYVNPNSGRDW